LLEVDVPPRQTRGSVVARKPERVRVTEPVEHERVRFLPDAIAVAPVPFEEHAFSRAAVTAGADFEHCSRRDEEAGGPMDVPPDVDATIRQIERLQEVGCEIARVAVPDKRAGEALKEIVRRSILPVVADIHFDYRLALMALDAKVHKLRLNPGNIHNKDGVREVTRRAKEQGTPIRIGVNHGSIGDRQPGDRRDEAQRMVDLALSEIKILEDLDFDDIVRSVR